MAIISYFPFNNNNNVQLGHKYVQVGHTYVQVGHTCVRSNNPSTVKTENHVLYQVSSILLIY